MNISIPNYSMTLSITLVSKLVLNHFIKLSSRFYNNMISCISNNELGLIQKVVQSNIKSYSYTPQDLGYVLKRVMLNVYYIQRVSKRVQEDIDVEEAIKSSYLYFHTKHPKEMVKVKLISLCESTSKLLL